MNEPMTVMPGDAEGCWVIRTARTTHLVDLEARAYARVPDPGRKPMPYDRTWLALRGLRGAPSVGEQFTVYVDALDSAEQVVEQLWRVSAQVVSIEQVTAHDLSAGRLRLPGRRAFGCQPHAGDPRR